MSIERITLMQNPDLACRDVDPEIFFPIGFSSRADQEQIKQAKAICKPCPAKEECLIVALKTPEDHGIWGGMTEDERRALKRRNARNNT